jgi:TPR repeat protein
MCGEGIGVLQSYIKETEHLNNAADKGHAIAQYNLGVMREKAARLGNPHRTAKSCHVRAELARSPANKSQEVILGK